jgi:two-component system NarL family response regulator
MKASRKIRVLIVEDHFMVRVGLTAIINSESDMAVVAEAKNGLDALDVFARHRPDVALVDLRIPGLDGLKVIERIVEQYPDAKVIVISTYGGDEDIYRAIEAGARGYYLKHVEGDELVTAIRAVDAGETRLPAEVATRLAERVSRTPLSPRELEVFQLMARGLSNHEIAATLSISEGTVRVHVSHALLKLGCNSRTQAIAEGFRRGIVQVER